MTKDPRPAWLMVAFGAGLTAFFAVAGCSRVGTMKTELSELRNSSIGTRVLGNVGAAATPAQNAATPAGDSLQLTNSGAMPRLAFAHVDNVVNELPEAERPLGMNGLCPANMASIDDRFCVDKWEASLVEVLPSGEERPYPYYMPVEGHKVRAVSQKGVYPQGYISGKEASAACKASGKRLCKPQEWKMACKGPDKLQYGHSNQRNPGTCNDHGRSPIGFYHASAIANGSAYSSNKIMNDPQLNQLPGTLAETGSHSGCTNGYGVYDMVGNIHEWVDDPAGTFQGGYYQDVEKNGEGCGYRTDAHASWYHDYSTGFRCCSDVGQ